MKKLLYTPLVAVAFLMATSFAYAQTSSKTAWIVSKNVNKIANKKLKADSESNVTHVEAKTVSYPTVAISKGIHRSSVSPSETESQGNIVSKGYPSWTVSKAIHRESSAKEGASTMLSRGED